MTDRTRIGAFGKVPPCHDGVDGNRQIHALGNIEQGRVIADAEQHSRIARSGIASHEKAANEFKLA